MALTLMVYNKPKLLIAATQAELDTATGFECQVNSARFDATVAFTPTPSTGCSGPGQTPATPAWALSITWLDDWTAPGGGLSGYAYENGDPPTLQWVRLVPDKDDPSVEGEAQVWITPGGMGGTFGDGSAGQSQADWQALGRPAFTYPPTLP